MRRFAHARKGRRVIRLDRELFVPGECSLLSPATKIPNQVRNEGLLQKGQRGNGLPDREGQELAGRFLFAIRLPRQ
jgi:hypothetical protein